MERNDKGQYKRGTNKNSFEGYGIWYDSKGYPIIFIGGKGIRLHVYLWERVNGPKLKGFDVHHKDFDKTNWKLDNLELLSASDHQKVHAGWVRSSGIWIAKPCTRCEKLLPLDQFYQRKGYTPSRFCKPCHKLDTRERETTASGRIKANERKNRWYHEHKDLVAKRWKLRHPPSSD